MQFKFFVISFISILFAACNSPSGNENHISEKESFNDLLLVSASGKKITIGTNDKDAIAKERPAMKLKFSYDFYLGRHEVTCKEFKELMPTPLSCESDNLPVSDVTYYDAVLFANARSKSEDMDTVYSYTNITFDSEGHCTDLENLYFNPEVKAYRLPTEAEWFFAASENWNPNNSWNATNSDYKPHEVCTKTSNPNDFCDMAGNVMEWVNDWLGRFKDTTITNYAGAPNDGRIDERVLKGGSFRNDLKTIRLNARGDIYTVTSKSKADYVGFRIAYGNTPDAVWISSSGAIDNSQLTPLASASNIKAFTGSNQTKLAFRNDITGNLAFINYANGMSSIVEIDDTLNVYHPEISPDGQKVAFSTGYEGISTKSSIYVRDLNAKGSNLVKLDVESAAIPRWRVLENGDTVIIYVSSAKNNELNSDFKNTSTWQVSFAHGKFGTPKKLFDGAYHGGISSDNRLAVSGSSRLRARIASKESTIQDNATDTIWYNEEQACNVSLTKDNSKKTSFLDFGGKTGKEFTGERYGVHEMLLIADSSGKLIQGIPSPLGYGFDHSEWTVGDTSLTSKGTGLIISALTDAENERHAKIVLINTADSSILELVKGAEIWHPCLWFAPRYQEINGAILDQDSAGVYFQYNSQNDITSSSVEIGIKLKEFWKQCDEVEFIALGSSMVLDAMIDDSIKTYKSLTMAATLADIHMPVYLLRNYIMPYAPKVKVVMVELSPGLMFGSAEDYLGAVRRYSPGLIYDENHLNKDSKNAIIERAVAQDYPDGLFTQNYIDGAFLLSIGSWGDTYFFFDTTNYNMDHLLLVNNLQMIEDLKHDLDDLGITMIMTITPRNPQYRNTGTFGLFGPSRTVAGQIIDRVKKMGIPIFDENKDGLHDYPDEMAHNNSHVSYLGAARYSQRLDEFLKELKSK